MESVLQDILTAHGGSLTVFCHGEWHTATLHDWSATATTASEAVIIVLAVAALRGRGCEYFLANDGRDNFWVLPGGPVKMVAEALRTAVVSGNQVSFWKNLPTFCAAVKTVTA